MSSARARRRTGGWALLLTLCAGLGCEREPERAPALESPDAIVLTPSQARGLATQAVTATEARAGEQAFGRVLDPSQLLEASGALAAARAAAAASARDLVRTRALAQDQENASEHDLAAAEVADAQARASLAQAQAHARAVWGTGDVARLAEPLARGDLAVARIEISAGLAAAPGLAIHVSAPALGIAERDAELIGAAGALDATLQTPALLVAIRGSPPPPGAALEARLEQGEALRGVFLPASAIVWSDGEPQAFVASGGDHFARRSVALARPLRDGYLATAGVAPGERVVTAGAQQLLSTLRVRSAPEAGDVD